MKKGKSRTRVARRDILKRMPRTRERVRDLQSKKRNYPTQAYQKSNYDGNQEHETR